MTMGPQLEKDPNDPLNETRLRDEEERLTHRIERLRAAAKPRDSCDEVRTVEQQRVTHSPGL